jgi:hypothetical protein
LKNKNPIQKEALRNLEKVSRWKKFERTTHKTGKVKK